MYMCVWMCVYLFPNSSYITSLCSSPYQPPFLFEFLFMKFCRDGSLSIIFTSSSKSLKILENINDINSMENKKRP